MLKIWTEEFLSVSILAGSIFPPVIFFLSSTTVRERNARVFTDRVCRLFSDYIETGSEIHSAALPRSGWEKLRAEYEARGRLC